VAALAGGELALVDCAASSNTGQARFHVDAAAQRIWSDVPWQCWSVDGDRLTQQPCSDAALQRFVTEPSGNDTKILAGDGRCVTAGAGSSSNEATLELATCVESPQQIFRL
jgi:hypothetical protein